MSWIEYSVVALLLAGWLWWLGMPLVKTLWAKRTNDTIGQFNRQLTELSQAPRRSLAETEERKPLGLTPGRWRAQTAQKRRLQVFLALSMSVVVSLVMAVAFRSVFVGVHLAMDILWVTFFALAAREGGREMERRHKVHYLDAYEDDQYVEDPYQDDNFEDWQYEDDLVAVR